MSFFSDVEKVIAKQGLDGLIHLEFYYGLDLELARQTKSGPYSDVHGIDAGQPGKKVMDFVGILQGDDFFESNSTLAPAFVAGFLYTRCTEILQGDTIRILSEDTNEGNRHRRYKITKIESIGLTSQVFKRYKLSAMGN